MIHTTFPADTEVSYYAKCVVVSDYDGREFVEQLPACADIRQAERDALAWMQNNDYESDPTHSLVSVAIVSQQGSDPKSITKHKELAW